MTLRSALGLDEAPRLDELPPLEQDPAQVREAADRILAQPAYRPPRQSVLERAIDWVLDRLEDLLGSVGASGGGVGDVVSFVILGAVIALLVWVLLRADWGSLRRRRPAPADGPLVQVEGRPGTGALRSRAAAAESAGRWREALRLWFAVLVSELVAAGVVDAVPGRTAGEYRREIAAARPAAAPSFRRAAELFEDAWYGHGPVDAATCATMRALTSEVLAAADEGDRPQQTVSVGAVP